MDGPEISGNDIADELENALNDEAWMHAACLAIAETGQKWGDKVHPSPAMLAVYNLKQERDALLEAVNAYLEWEEAESSPTRTHSACVALLVEAERLARKAVAKKEPEQTLREELGFPASESL